MTHLPSDSPSRVRPLDPQRLLLRSFIGICALALGCWNVACSSDGGSEEVRQDGLVTGPTMLPGDNCRSCHGGPSSQYPEAPEWTVAGTVFESAESDVGAPGVTVMIRDISGNMLELTTNSVGNFYTQAAFDFPYWVSLKKDGVVVDMPAPPPSGGCNACHNAPAVAGAPGRLYVPSDGTFGSTAECAEDRSALLVGVTTYDCAPFACEDAVGTRPARCLMECASDEHCSVGLCESGTCAE